LALVLNGGEQKMLPLKNTAAPTLNAYVRMYSSTQCYMVAMVERILRHSWWIIYELTLHIPGI